MIARLLLMRHARALQGRVVRVRSDAGNLLGRLSTTSWPGLVIEDWAGDTVLVPWFAVNAIEHGPSVDHDFGKMAQGFREQQEKRAAAGRAGSKPALSPDEVEELLRSFNGGDHDRAS